VRVAVLVLLVGCSFEHGVAVGDAGGTIDADVTTRDGDASCGLVLDLCAESSPPGPLYDNRFGYGGAGGASTAAVVGVSSVVAGGGGGGGVGIVKLLGTTSIDGVISPPPT